MTTTLLDTTYEYGKLLEKSNISELQIDVLIARDKQTTQLILNTLDEKFATKNDLKEVKVELKHDISLILKDIMWIKVFGTALSIAILAVLTVLLSR